MKHNIAITSGFFNPLHDGHIKYLAKAYSYAYKNGDLDPILWVIVNNDKQVELKKSIPFLSAEIRVKIIDSLYMVHYAFLSEDTEDTSVAKTLEGLAKKYKRDNVMFFINAGDRTGPNIAEHEVCDKYGIQEVFLDLPKINSSSEIIANTANKYYDYHADGLDIWRD